MQHCPYCGCDSLIKNGSTRGVPKWRCKTCGRQTSLKGDHTETDRQHDQARSEAVLLYLSGLSLTAIGFLKSVVPSTILRWVRRFAQQRAAKPHPGPGGVIVMEIDEVWHFVGNKKNKLWIWLALCRDTGQLVDWGCGDRDQTTLDRLLQRLKAWKVLLVCTDRDTCYDQAMTRLCRWGNITRVKTRLGERNKSTAAFAI